MKNFILILIILLNINVCFGTETLGINLGSNYLITTDWPILANAVGNPAVLTINPFFTIFNEKNILLVHPEKAGKTSLTLFTDKEDVVFDVIVKPETAPCTFNPIKKDGYEITLLDEPPEFENFEIDAPPIKMEGN